MSLSRPVKFPVLKLPFLCIESVIKNWDIFDIIFFAFTSKKTGRIVKSFKIPLNANQISISETTTIWLGGFPKTWVFSKPRLEPSFDHNSRRTFLMLQNNPIPLYTSITNDSLTSYTFGNGVAALKMVMEFLNEVFKCSVEEVNIYGDNFPLSGNIGVKSTVNLFIDTRSSQPFGHTQSQKLSSLLKNLEVTGTCEFWMRNTERDFYVAPKLFKCKKVEFCYNSGAWVTKEILMQFEVPQLKFEHCSFPVEDVLAFVTHWFHSDNKKFEYLLIVFRSVPISLENFQTEELNPVPFSGRTRIPPIEPYTRIDFSVGLEIVRDDGSEASIYVNNGVFLFHIWHNQ